MALVTVGTAVFLVMLAVSDRTSNPVGLGIVFTFTFWPGVVLLVIEVVSAQRSRKRRARR